MHQRCHYFVIKAQWYFDRNLVKCCWSHCNDLFLLSWIRYFISIMFYLIDDKNLLQHNKIEWIYSNLYFYLKLAFKVQLHLNSSENPVLFSNFIHDKHEKHFLKFVLIWKIFIRPIRILKPSYYMHYAHGKFVTRQRLSKIYF